MNQWDIFELSNLTSAIPKGSMNGTVYVRSFTFTTKINYINVYIYIGKYAISPMDPLKTPRLFQLQGLSKVLRSFRFPAVLRRRRFPRPPRIQVAAQIAGAFVLGGWRSGDGVFFFLNSPSPYCRGSSLHIVYPQKKRRETNELKGCVNTFMPTQYNHPASCGRFIHVHTHLHDKGQPRQSSSSIPGCWKHLVYKWFPSGFYNSYMSRRSGGPTYTLPSLWGILHKLMWEKSHDLQCFSHANWKKIVGQQQY